MSYNHGNAGKVTVGSGPTTLEVREWSADHNVKEEETTNTTHGGKTHVQPGNETLKLKVQAQWSSTNNPYSSPPALTPGTHLTAAKFYIVSTDTNPLYNVSDAYVIKAAVKSSVDGMITWDIDLTANAWTLNS